MHNLSAFPVSAPLFSIPGSTSIHDGDICCDANYLQKQVDIQIARLNRLGIGATDRVIIYAPKSIACCALLLAVFSLGAVAVPVYHGLLAKQLEHVLKDCRPKAVFTSTYDSAQINNLVMAEGCLHETVVPGETGTASILPSEIADLSGRLPAAIIYTSGSTGLPKGVVFSRENLVLGAQSVAEFTRLSRADCVLCALPFSFDAGLMCMFSALVAGSQIVLVNFVHAAQLKSICQRHGVTAITAVPGLWSRIGGIDWGDCGASVRTICNTGGHLSGPLSALLERTFPQAFLIPMYGFTEAFRCSYMPADRAKQKPGAVGRSIPHSSFAIVSKFGRLCKPGETGELVQFGPLVTLGYWNNLEATAEKFRDVGSELRRSLQNGAHFPYRIDPSHLTTCVWSGDLATIDRDGDLYIIGRNDDMMKVNGFRISPFEIEHVCFTLGCKNAFAHCRQAGGEDEIVLAYSGGPPEAELKSGLAANLPAYMMPRHIVPIDEFPITRNGKIDRPEVMAMSNARLERPRC